jgi:hypothetical protein
MNNMRDEMTEQAAEVEGVRRRHLSAKPDPCVNPAWANAEVDISILLACYDALAECCIMAREALAALTDSPAPSSDSRSGVDRVE